MKAKSAAKSHKASLAKLANKRTNRLAKQGKLNKGEKKNKKKRLLKEAAAKKQQQQNLPELGSDGEDHGDEDVEEEGLTQGFQYFRRVKNIQEFLSSNLIAEEKHSSKKRKRPEDDEAGYEQQTRTFPTDERLQNMKMVLPIIAHGKVIKRMVEKDVTESRQAEEVDTLDIKPSPTEKQQEEEMPPTDAKPNLEEEKAFLASLSPVELFAYRKNKLAEKKQKIAALSHAVLEDPQNSMKKLKELRLMLGELALGVSLTVRKLTMVSLIEVFKDIVPGYRLRIPTEKERTQRVKKETKSLWDYEASFLLNYRIYLEFLETMAKGKPVPEKSFLTKHGIRDLKIPPSHMLDMRKLALSCLCQMLVSHPHFNYSNNIMATIIPFMSHKNSQLSDVACGAVTRTFREDRSGEVTLELVRNIGRMAKSRKFNIRPKVLDTFLVLKIKEVNLSSADGKFKKMKKKEKMMLSRRERKRLKQKEQLDKELLETKAATNREQKLKLHTEIIQAVFETYIRVIKLAADSRLLPAVLEGLARFAHLINVEYFDSLFGAFNSLIQSEKLSTREMLHCMQTAFTILSGQGSVINVDPASFYKHFYQTLPLVHAGSPLEMGHIVLQCLDSMINKRRRQLSQQRVLAFMKRISSLSLHQSTELTIAYLALVRQFVHTYKFTDILFESEAQGTGVYQPLLEDPEHCSANSTALWELHLLQHHYCPDVQTCIKHVFRGCPLTGEHQLPQTLARKSPRELYEDYKTQESYPVEKPKSRQKRKVTSRITPAADLEFMSYLQTVLQSQPDLPQPLR